LHPIGALQQFSWNEPTLTVRTVGADLLITVLAADLVRVELVPDGSRRATESYAVVKRDWPPCPVTVTEEPHRVVLRTTGVGAAGGVVAGTVGGDAAGEVGGAAPVPLLQTA